MNWSPPARRGLDVVSPVTVYLVIGRRPSSVFLDDRRVPRNGANGIGHRLWDRVFRAIEARPGDQLQDRPGGLVLVTGEGESHLVQLSPPEARCVESAFTHAGDVLAADLALAETLIAEGRLSVGSTRRAKVPPVRTNQTVYAEDHPLVV